jgi:uncharacterized protein YbjT (DUF2867 family)
MTSVLVVGATGYVGRPVAQRLLSDGRRVRVLVRDQARALQMIGEGFEYFIGTISDQDAVARAVEGCDWVHISVDGNSVAEMMEVESTGTAAVAAAAAKAGVRLLTYVSANLVREPYGPKIPEHRAKIAAEDAIRACGVPYVIFRPTWEESSLRRFSSCGSWSVSENVATRRSLSISWGLQRRPFGNGVRA